MKFGYPFLFASLLFAAGANAGNPPPDPALYRTLTNHLRTESAFEVKMPFGQNQKFNYHFKLGAPVYPVPPVNDFQLSLDPTKFYRMFFDRILFTDESYIELGGERLPLTCVFIDGQDNRFAKDDNPVFSDYIMKVYLVANDYSCIGPINPGWPENGQRKERWDTYLYFEIRDPTIMLPTEVKLRYRWNEYSSVFVDGGVPEPRGVAR